MEMTVCGVSYELGGADLEVPLTFLGDGRYTREIYADAPDADKNATHTFDSERGCGAGNGA